MSRRPKHTAGKENARRTRTQHSPTDGHADSAAAAAAAALPPPARLSTSSPPLSVPHMPGVRPAFAATNPGGRGNAKNWPRVRIRIPKSRPLTAWVGTRDGGPLPRGALSSRSRPAGRLLHTLSAPFLPRMCGLPLPPAPRGRGNASAPNPGADSLGWHTRWRSPAPWSALVALAARRPAPPHPIRPISAPHVRPSLAASPQGAGECKRPQSRR